MLPYASAILALYFLSNLVNWVHLRVGLIASQMVIYGQVLAMTILRTAL